MYDIQRLEKCPIPCCEKNNMFVEQCSLSSPFPGSNTKHLKLNHSRDMDQFSKGFEKVDFPTASETFLTQHPTCPYFKQDLQEDMTLTGKATTEKCSPCPQNGLNVTS